MDAQSPIPSAGEPQPERPRYRPPIGIPVDNQRRTRSLILAVLVHALIIALLIIPFAAPEAFRAALGAGGLGPAGGGGGGNRGTGGQVRQERIQFVHTPPPTPTLTPPVVKPPVLKPPVVPPPPQPTPTPPPPAASAPAASATTAEATANLPGTGGGAGIGGGAGNGPGTGGGSGSGTGTGVGTRAGAGTGGGTGTAYPPAPTELFLPPLPVPSKARGTIVVVFDVDSTGKVLDLHFEPTKDGNYNKKLREALSAIRFRPAVSAQGVPIRARTEITYSL